MFIVRIAIKKAEMSRKSIPEIGITDEISRVPRKGLFYKESNSLYTTIRVLQPEVINTRHPIAHRNLKRVHSKCQLTCAFESGSTQLIEDTTGDRFL